MVSKRKERSNAIHRDMTQTWKKLVASGVLLASLQGSVLTVFADESAAPTTEQAPKTKVQKLSEDVNALKVNQASIRLQLTNLKGKTDAKAQKLNIQSQLDACELKLKNAETELKAEQDRVAEEARKAEEAKKAEEARKAEEAKKAEADHKKNEAIATGKPVVSHYVPNYTPHANSYPWGQCTWGAKVLAPWAGDYWGNGGQWAASAAAAGFKTGNAPVAGALISWNDGGYGHIAFVTDVREDGMIQVLEANYGGSAYAANPAGIQNYRGWFNPASGGSYTYIYPKN